MHTAQNKSLYHNVSIITTVAVNMLPSMYGTIIAKDIPKSILSFTRLGDKQSFSQRECVGQ